MEKGGRRIGRVGGLVVDWGSASSQGLGRTMDGGEGAVRYESVNARKRRSSPAARARAQKGTYCFNIFRLADSGWFGSWFGIKVGTMRHDCVFTPSS